MPEAVSAPVQSLFGLETRCNFGQRWGKGVAGDRNLVENRSVKELLPDGPLVLVVEDEFLVRLTAVDAIEDAGFTVLEAEDADRALELLQHRTDIGVLFTDIKMPGRVDGLELARVVRERWPAIKIILTSGHLYREDVDMPLSVPFLQKPYRARELIAGLVEVIR